MQTEAEREAAKKLFEMERENHNKMMKEKEKLRNSIRQMSIKMQAHRERTKSNPMAFLNKRGGDNINCKIGWF